MLQIKQNYILMCFFYQDRHYLDFGWKSARMLALKNYKRKITITPLKNSQLINEKQIIINLIKISLLYICLNDWTLSKKNQQLANINIDIEQPLSYTYH